MINKLLIFTYIFIIVLFTVIISRKDDKIEELQKEINWRVELTRTQEDWLRSCGFYGKED